MGGQSRNGRNVNSSKIFLLVHYKPPLPKLLEYDFDYSSYYLLKVQYNKRGQDHFEDKRKEESKGAKF